MIQNDKTAEMQNTMDDEAKAVNQGEDKSVKGPSPPDIEQPQELSASMEPPKMSKTSFCLVTASLLCAVLLVALDMNILGKSPP